jgi:glyoxylase-like metal-dependent hydrolase (beta-lactamase superfamily II)
MDVRGFFHDDTFTVTYVAWDPHTRDAVVIDPVLDLNLLTWRTSRLHDDLVAAFVAEKGLAVRWILDTHAHADHLSGMADLKARFGAPTAIGRRITEIQALFGPIFNLGEDFPTDGRQFDRLLDDGEHLRAGSLMIEAIHTPGHTPACVSYRVAAVGPDGTRAGRDAVFTGDTLFMPDYGTGRCDFPHGNARDLYASITRKLYTLPEATRVFVGHDYLPNGRPPAWETTIGQSKEQNLQLRAHTAESDFVAFREARDRTLPPPRYILPSLQVNIRAGALPDLEDNGRRYFRIPIDLLGKA